MSEGKGRAPHLDRLLAEWPTAQRSAMEWDEAAEGVLARVGSGAAPRSSAGVSDEDLLRPPLPASTEEVQRSAPIETGKQGTATMTTSAGRERERDRATLKDLAKLASMTPAPPSAKPPVSSGVVSAEASTAQAPGEGAAEPKPEREENSGVINLAALAAGEASASGAAGTSSVKPAATGAAGVPPSTSTLRSAEPLLAPASASAPAAPASTTAPPQAPAPARAPRQRSGAAMFLGGVVAAAAVAAGLFFGLQGGRHPDGAVALAPASPAAAAPTQASAAGKPAGGAAQPAATPIAPEDRGVDPSSLPEAVGGQGGAGAVAHGLPAPAAKGGVAAGPMPTVAATPSVAPSLVAVIPPAAAPAPLGSANLQALMQQAAGVTSTTAPTATATATADDSLPAPGSVPLKPSLGAIQGALGAAMPAARACLGPDDPISHATITFKADGSVQSVSISGGAAGKPAEACVRSALSRARVPPFVQPTYTVPATVRPN